MAGNSENISNRHGRKPGFKGRLGSLLHKNAPKPVIAEAAEARRPEFVIFDENAPGNLLSEKAREIDLSDTRFHQTISTEGFGENPSRQAELAVFLTNTLNIAERGATLDVGFGQNIHISNTFAANGIEAYAIDELADSSRSGSIFHPPRKLHTNEAGVTIYSGDIAEIGESTSELRGKNFGTVLFNGSWDSTGNNFTVGGEMAEASYHEKKPDVSLYEFLRQQKAQILEGCKDHLSDNGLIGVVSSRYAFHGGGFNFSNLPLEKLSFVDLFRYLEDLGAKRFYLFGVTQQGFDEMLQRSTEQFPQELREFMVSADEIKRVRRELANIGGLPPENVYTIVGQEPEYERAFLQKAIDRAKTIPEFEKLARIDALFAEF